MALSSVMRAMTFWGAGSLTLTQDRPTDASYLFNLSNITSEGFIYSGTSLKTRSTVVSVSYFDMNNQEPDFETVEDTAAKNSCQTRASYRSKRSSKSRIKKRWSH
jgi:predicted phage tail protein